MNDVLGYVVVEWNQAGLPSVAFGPLPSDLDWAHDVARSKRLDAELRGRGGRRISVHAVMAEEIEEGS